MKQKKLTRHAEVTPPTKPERRGLVLVIDDNLTLWINKSTIRACRNEANEIHYTRGKDGLTVETRKGTRVLEARGPHKLYQDRAILRLKQWAHMNLSDDRARQAGKFGVLVDDREWNMRPSTRRRARASAWWSVSPCRSLPPGSSS